MSELNPYARYFTACREHFGPTCGVSGAVLCIKLQEPCKAPIGVGLLILKQEWDRPGGLSPSKKKTAEWEAAKAQAERYAAAAAKKRQA